MLIDSLKKPELEFFFIKISLMCTNENFFKVYISNVNIKIIIFETNGKIHYKERHHRKIVNNL
jgi:hypothetical protein